MPLALSPMTVSVRANLVQVGNRVHGTPRNSTRRDDAEGRGDGSLQLQRNTRDNKAATVRKLWGRAWRANKPPPPPGG